MRILVILALAALLAGCSGDRIKNSMNAHWAQPQRGCRPESLGRQPIQRAAWCRVAIAYSRAPSWRGLGGYRTTVDRDRARGRDAMRGA